MSAIQLLVHPPVGEPFSAELPAGSYTAGSAQSVPIQLPYPGVAERHLELWVGADCLQVEPLGEGVRVNRHAISERVEVAFPALVEFAGVRLSWALRVEELEPLVSGVLEVLPKVRLPEGAGGSGVSPSPLSDAAQALLASQCAPTLVGHGSGPQPLRDSGMRLEAGEPLAEAGRGSQSFAPLAGGYELVREIARGGMGRIYFGEDPGLEREVAVKVSLVAHAGEDPRFEKEAKVLAQLAHPNIVPIHAKGVDGQGRPYYSMKLVKGRTLQAILKGLAKGDSEIVREYPLSALLTIFRKVADAMAFAHSKRILHRDLKPENIMVGEYGEVLVMDWGLAKKLGESEAGGVARGVAVDSGNYGMTMEGEVMGTPQYMSPEQAEGMVGELDERSDVYSLGGILYAILTLRAPIDGKTLEEVLTKVKSGKISSMASRAVGEGGAVQKSLGAMGRLVPEALQAVTLKAMSLQREKRYGSVEAFASDIAAYQNGFATLAEEAGAWRRMRLWVGRNRVLAGSAAAMLLVVSGFSAKVIVEGRKASEALRALRASAPVFSQRAEDALQEGDLEAALEAATSALRLEAGVEDYHRIRGNVLQSMMRFSEAAGEYRLAGGGEQVQINLQLSEALIQQLEKEGVEKTRRRLFQELNAQGRQGEATALMAKKDPTVIPELVQRLESKLLPVPGTKILMSKTELTVGEWKLYLKAEGLPGWQQPMRKSWKQNNEHPVVNVTWNQAMKFCEWLRKSTGKEWGLPTHAEWEAAAGKQEYPWGDYYPPNWDDGNYSILPDGKPDPKNAGVDGIVGTAPVASFKPNQFGFYDLGGNAWEWVSDGFDRIDGPRYYRGGSWDNSAGSCRVSVRYGYGPNYEYSGNGFRVVRRSGN